MAWHRVLLVALCFAAPVAANVDPTSTLGNLPRLPSAAGLTCDAIEPTVAHIAEETRTVSEQVAILADQPRRSASADVPGEVSALLDDHSVTMCVTEFGDYDWLMDLDFKLDSDLSGLRQERLRQMDGCPLRAGFPDAECVKRIDAGLAVKARSLTDAYLAAAQAGLDREAGRMATCTKRRDEAVDRLFQAGGFDLQATGIQVESWKLANLATERWQDICRHATGALATLPTG